MRLIASREAILRAARNAPGAAQPTPAPQGSGSPWIGQLPSYGTMPGPNFSGGYGPFLPRPPETFTEGAFGPFSPILPVPIDQPPPGLPRPQPRRWQPRVGYNLPVGEPGSEGYKLASFSTLSSLANAYSILRTCVDRRKNEIRGMDWDIVLTKDAAKAYRGDRKAMRDFGERRAKAVKWFRKPDPNYNDFASWFFALMEQTFTIDALSLYLCPKKARGLGRGLLGSDLDCLWAIDGSSIRPLMGLHGEHPAQPAPAWQQYEFGVPRADYMMMLDGRDLTESGLTDADLRWQGRGDQLIYWPYDPRTDSPYGQSLVEKALIPVMTGLRKQAYQLDFFSESTIPAVYITPGASSGVTPNQVRELQDAMNAIAGDINWNFKVIVLPPDSKVLPQKAMEIVDQADEWIASEVAMVCDINPMEIGLLPKVSTVASPFAAREMAQTSRSAHERTSTKPTLAYYTAIFNTILQGVCGQEDMRFLFSGMEEMADQAAMSDMDIKDVQSGIRAIDEVRDERGLVPWDLPETTGPVVFTTMGPIPLGGKNPGILPGSEPPTGAHAAAQGAMGAGSQPRALPAGQTGRGRMNGPVTQRQARRGGALAPAHSTAEGAPGRSGGRPVPKAAMAELEALTRHLAKGRDIATWQPQHLPAQVLMVMADDLTKGLSPAQCAEVAAPLILGADSYEWLPKASGQTAAQRQEQRRAALERQYAARLRAAFASAAAAIAALIARWAAGLLMVTAAGLGALIALELRKALRAALEPLWREAWRLGEQEAGGSASEALEAFLATWGEQVAQWVSDTDIAVVAAALRDLGAMKRKAMTAELLRLLEADMRSDAIAASEFTRALNMAILAVWRMLGVAEKAWITMRDGNVCPACLANQAQGFIPLAQLFKSGDLCPLCHNRCRCRLVRRPGPLPGLAKAVRSVPLNGQELWAANPAGGGGRGPVPHAADGTQVWGGVPGATAGGEPPRWDGTEPVYDAERVGQDGDDGAWGEAAGLGSRPGMTWPNTYGLDGYWPLGGIGTEQAAASSVGGDARGRAPGPTGKAAGSATAVLASAPKAKAGAVYALMRGNFPPAALTWVKRIRWVGPVEVPLDGIDWSSEREWAASHQQGRVDHFAAELRAGREVPPSVAVIRPGHGRVRIIDGHHRSSACRKLGIPSRCYVGYLDSAADEQAAYETHSYQEHQGDDPANKSLTRKGAGMEAFQDRGEPVRQRYGIDGTAGDAQDVPHPFTSDVGSHGTACVACGLDRGSLVHAKAATCAGLAVRAEDTGRVLMLRRAAVDGDPAAGLWEFPGGHAEPGETLLQAALREWSEETGCALPRGTLAGHWEASNGVYEGFMLSVPDESATGDRDATWNPDDPHGDLTEAVAWMDPAHIRDHPDMRPELLADLPLVLEALGEMAMA